MSNKDPAVEARIRAAKHDAKVKAGKVRAAQKARGRAARGSDPNRVTRDDLRAL